MSVRNCWFPHGDRYFSTNQLTFHQNHLVMKLRGESAQVPVSVAGEENGLPEGLAAKLGRLGQNHVKSLHFCWFYGWCEIWTLWNYMGLVVLKGRHVHILRYSLVDLGSKLCPGPTQHSSLIQRAIRVLRSIQQFVSQIVSRFTLI